MRGELLSEQKYPTLLLLFKYYIINLVNLIFYSPYLIQLPHSYSCADLSFAHNYKIITLILKNL